MQVTGDHKGASLVKDFKLGSAIGDDISFDDFFQLKEFKSDQYKVSAVEIAKDTHQSGYITGLRFTYSSLRAPYKTIRGNVMGTSNVFELKEKHKSIIFNLENDEFLIEFTGRKGMIVDRFGFRTNLGKIYEFGGQGGGPYSLVAPEGFHFVNFGALFSKGWGNISLFSADIASIPSKELLSGECVQDNLTNRAIQGLIKLPVFRHLISFLSIREVSRLFQTCSLISQLRCDTFVSSSLYLRCLFSGNIKTLNYGEILVKQYSNQNSMNSLIDGYRQKCKNLISSDQAIHCEPMVDQKKNNDGLDGATYFSIRGYSQPKFNWKSSFEAGLFTIEEIAAFAEGKLGLVGGVQISWSGYGTSAKLILNIEYEDGAIVRAIKNLVFMSRDYDTFNIAYCRRVAKDEKNDPNKRVVQPFLMPVSITFSLEMHEPSSWEARLKQFHLRKLPFENEIEIQCAAPYKRSQTELEIIQVNCVQENMLI